MIVNLEDVWNKEIRFFSIIFIKVDENEFVIKIIHEGDKLKEDEEKEEEEMDEEMEIAADYKGRWKGAAKLKGNIKRKKRNMNMQQKYKMKWMKMNL